MKRVLSLLFGCCLAVASYSQVTVDEIPLSPSFSHVFNSTLDINKRFVNAKSWIATSFGDYKSVLQYEDAENYRIIIKGKTPVFIDTVDDEIRLNRAVQYSFTMTFDFKDDRYRIKFEDIAVKTGISVGDRECVPDIDTNWDQHFTLNTSSTEREIVELKSKKADLEAALPELRRRRRRSTIKASEEAIAEIDKQIANDEDYILNRAPKLHRQNVLRFKAVFSDFFNSAAKQIEEDDDF